MKKRLVAATAAYIAVHVRGTASVKLTEDEVILDWVIVFFSRGLCTSK